MTRNQAIGIVVERSGLVEVLGIKVLRAAAGLGDLEGEARQRAVEAIGSAVRQRIARELDEVFKDDEVLFENARYFESRAATSHRETVERLADTASPFALLEEAMADPRMPKSFLRRQETRPVIRLGVVR